MSCQLLHSAVQAPPRRCGICAALRPKPSSLCTARFSQRTPLRRYAKRAQIGRNCSLASTAISPNFHPAPRLLKAPRQPVASQSFRLTRLHNRLRVSVATQLTLNADTTAGCSDLLLTSTKFLALVPPTPPHLAKSCPRGGCERGSAFDNARRLTMATLKIKTRLINVALALRCSAWRDVGYTSGNQLTLVDVCGVKWLASLTSETFSRSIRPWVCGC